MTSLKPVDFKAVAAKGAYVYCYLREDGTPYYVGLSLRADRPFRRSRKDMKPPAGHPERVRVLRSGLTKEEACKWEIFFIAHYGCKYNNTGILRNKCPGGEGVSEKTPEGTLAHRKAIIEQGEAFQLSGMEIEDYLELTNKQIDAMIPWCKRNLELTGYDYLNGVRDTKGQKAACLKGRATRDLNAAKAFAAKHQISLETVQALTWNERRAAQMYFSRNPENSFSDWMAAKGQAPGKAGGQGNKIKAAQRLGLELDLYLSIPSNTVKAMSKWLREHSDGSAIEYLQKRGFTAA